MVYPYSTCSVTCGGGQKVREVRCVQEQSRDDGVVPVDEARCGDEAAPTSVTVCNTTPCPANWTVEAWTQVLVVNVPRGLGDCLLIFIDSWIFIQ